MVNTTACVVCRTSPAWGYPCTRRGNASCATARQIRVIVRDEDPPHSSLSPVAPSQAWPEKNFRSNPTPARIPGRSSGTSALRDAVRPADTPGKTGAMSMRSGARRSCVAPRRVAACYPSAMTRGLAARLVPAAWTVALIVWLFAACAAGRPTSLTRLREGYEVLTAHCEARAPESCTTVHVGPYRQSRIQMRAQVLPLLDGSAEFALGVR